MFRCLECEGGGGECVESCLLGREHFKFGGFLVNESGVILEVCLILDSYYIGNLGRSSGCGVLYVRR